MTVPFPEKMVFPHELEIVSGTLDSGDVKTLRDDDDTYVEVSEVAATPGFEIVLTFKQFVAPKFTKQLILNMTGWYEGNAGHDVKLYIWNYDTDSWDGVTGDAKDFADETSKQTYAFEFSPEGGQADFNRFNAVSEVKFMIRHDDAGNVNHDMFLDQVWLGFSSLEASAGIHG